MFPTNPEEFDADDRISFSKVSNTFILETEDGREFQWNQALKRWIEEADDDEFERQQQAYAVAGVDEAEPAMNPRKKRKQDKEDRFEEGRQSPASKRPRNPPQADSQGTTAPAKDTRRNTAVYVTNLPLNTDADEVTRVFSRCGVIAEEIDSGRPRIKLYEDDKGQFKGDALIVYFRPESVQLAIQMLDDTDFRLGEALPAGRMSVVEADRTYKRQNNDPAGTTTISAVSGGAVAKNGHSNSNAGTSQNGKPTTSGAQQHQPDTKSRRERELDKRKVIARTQKLNARLADWSDDEDVSALSNTASSRWDKIIILKHMFTLAELDEDPAALLDIKDDIREECGKMGEVTNVVLYDAEPDGVASVRFADERAARAAVAAMDGRWFAGTQVVAYVSRGERFRKSKAQKKDVDEEDGWEVDAGAGEEEDMRRAEKFGRWLEESEREERVPAVWNGGGAGGGDAEGGGVAEGTAVQGGEIRTGAGGLDGA